VGVVSRANLVQALASASALFHQPTDSDRAIRQEILARLSKQRWTGFGERNVVVTDGFVHLWGLANSPEERRALLALVESTPAVRGVADEMIASYL
jgi:osmotically-inducible protein OsmY